MWARGHPRRTAPGRHGSAAEQWALRRQAYLDNLKVVLIAAIIAIHAVVGYSELGWWSYADVREITLSPVTDTVLLVAVGPFGLFIIALLFLVAGLLTVPSLERKGTRAYVRDRLLRLGVPLAVFILVLQPTLMYALYHPLGAAPGSYWFEFLGVERQLDTGPLWFVGVLLIFSLVHAGWAKVRPHQPRPVRITAPRLLLLAVAVAAVTLRSVWCTHWEARAASRTSTCGSGRRPSCCSAWASPPPSRDG